MKMQAYQGRLWGTPNAGREATFQPGAIRRHVGRHGPRPGERPGRRRVHRRRRSLDVRGAHATGQRKNSCVLTRRHDIGPDAGVLVAAGGGFEQARVDQLFEALYTTKPDGLGMGLSMSRSIILSHGGRLWATPNASHGATFQFVVPAWKGRGHERR
jgi:hypothetical protein